ncbi:MAG: T9SS type A sorting domain-containing protein [Ignavibacteria bacterium]|nr:MAG: T9SS type A sorting domain-containing protein [Ignavibacteria bacterium]
MYSLAQNYPDPFNPTTTLRYDLPQPSYVLMTVHNVLGQLVKTLVDGVQDAGFRSVSFDASALPSGVYFYRLQAGDFVGVKKMLLAK